MDEKIHRFEGEGITVSFRPRRCIHSAECVRHLGAVFQPGQRPWVRPDAASPDEVARVVGRCPTGALTFERTDGGPAEPVPARNTAYLVPDGPIQLRGRIRVISMGGDVMVEGTRLALCRCGASRHKPLCDNSHVRAGFRDAGAVPWGEPPEAVAGETLDVVLSPKGPLMLRGAVTLLSGDGAVRTEAGSRALCRCGHSGHKPYCDGSHAKAGFTGA